MSLTIKRSVIDENIKEGKEAEKEKGEVRSCVWRRHTLCLKFVFLHTEIKGVG